MRVWHLQTRLPELGTVACIGIEEDDQVTFLHPREDEGIVLRVSVRRAYEISRWTYQRSQRMNTRIVVTENTKEGEEHCACGELIVVVQSAIAFDVIHSIPFCDAFKKLGNKLYQGRLKSHE